MSRIGSYSGCLPAPAPHWLAKGTNYPSGLGWRIQPPAVPQLDRAPSMAHHVGKSLEEENECAIALFLLLQVVTLPRSNISEKWGWKEGGALSLTKKPKEIVFWQEKKYV